jgi:hypothetical protein
VSRKIERRDNQRGGGRSTASLLASGLSTKSYSAQLIPP